MLSAESGSTKSSAAARPLQSAGSDIDRQRKYDRVEEEGQDAMRGADVACRLGGKRCIGGLPGCANDRREIDKVGVIRIFLARKLETWVVAARRRRVVVVGVVQREDQVHEGP